MQSACLLLENCEFATAFVPVLKKKTQGMNHAFKHVKFHIQSKTNDEETYKKAYRITESVMEWWNDIGSKQVKSFTESLRPDRKSAKSKAKAAAKDKRKQ